MESIELSLEGHIGIITLNSPKKLNALSHALVEEVVSALRNFAERDARVVILRARPGVKVWSAGHDVSELPEGRRDPLGWDDPLRNLVRTIETYPAPVIAERAERVGMINHVVELDELEKFTLGMAHTIADNSPLGIRVMKEQLRVLTGAKPVSPRGFEKVQGLRRVVYDSYDYAEGIRAFKEKRRPKYLGR